MPDDIRAARQRRNEAYFRGVRQRASRLGGADPGEESEHRLVCECSDPSCHALVTIRLDRYHVARQGDGFIVLRGHERRGEDTLLEDGGAYLVVRARAAAGL